VKPKGIENAEAVMEACRATLASAGSSQDEELRRTLESIVSAIEGLLGVFFLKTNPAIPVTRDCRRDAEELRGRAQAGQAAESKATLERLKTNMEKLLKAAKMEGVIIT
jgi:hypothetical protein